MWTYRIQTVNIMKLLYRKRRRSYIIIHPQHTQFYILIVLLFLLTIQQALATSKSHMNNNIGVVPFDFQNCLHDLNFIELLRLQKSLNSIIMAEIGSNDDNQTDDRLQMMAKIKTNNTIIISADDDNEVNDCKAYQCKRPFALALVHKHHKQDRGGGYITKPVHTTYHHYHHHPWQQEPEKPSKLQTLFQISITALAFLSFGGYLLCLIVQAIKSKGTTYFHPVATATTAMMNGTGVRRIKIYRRSRRSVTIVTKHIPYAFWAPQRTVY